MYPLFYAWYLKNNPIYFLGFSSSDGNSDGQKDNQWFNPHSQKTVHGFDLSQVEDLEHIDHFNGMRNGATVTGEYSSSVREERFSMY